MRLRQLRSSPGPGPSLVNHGHGPGHHSRQAKGSKLISVQEKRDRLSIIPWAGSTGFFGAVHSVGSGPRPTATATATATAAANANATASSSQPGNRNPGRGP